MDLFYMFFRYIKKKGIDFSIPFREINICSGRYLIYLNSLFIIKDDEIFLNHFFYNSCNCGNGYFFPTFYFQNISFLFFTSGFYNRFKNGHNSVFILYIKLLKLFFSLFFSVFSCFSNYLQFNVLYFSIFCIFSYFFVFHNIFFNLLYPLII